MIEILLTQALVHHAQGNHPQALLALNSIIGAVIDASTALPLSGATITVSDSFGSHIAITDGQGAYAIIGTADCGFTAVFEKFGYYKQTLTATKTPGQIYTLNVQLAPVPPLVISVNSPSNGAVLYSTPVTVTGSVSNNASIVVNGIKAIVHSGSFSAAVSLSEGQNVIEATATDPYGQTVATWVVVTKLIPPGEAISLSGPGCRPAGYRLR